MKYLSLDLETTCLQPDPKHILQISMVVEDTSKPNVPVEELPHFTCFVKQPKIEGEAYALGMNGWILDYISGRKKDPPYKILAWKTEKELEETGYTDTWLWSALMFLGEHFGELYAPLISESFNVLTDKTKITVAGKNVAGFDIPFLPQQLRKYFRHKVLDPGTLYVNWATDDQVPNFPLCKERAGLGKEVAHDAREDAMDVIRLLRKSYT